MSQLTLDAALAHVDLNNLSWLQWARGEAQSISDQRGSVTTDNLREVSDRYGFQPDSPHAWGAVFKCAGWRCIGRQRSRYPSSNGRFIGVWRYAQTGGSHG